MERYKTTIAGPGRLALSLVTAFTLGGCASEPAPPAASDQPPATPPGYRIYVTNERSDDLSVIDSATHEVVATIPLGKRPRGIHASPDGKTIYVALSGSPIAGPGVDEDDLPAADKKADGIGVVDVAQGKLIKVISGGSDPEEFSLSPDGALLYSSNEDTGEASIIDVAAGTVVTAVKVGNEDAEPEGVETSPDGKFLYSANGPSNNVSVIDLATRSVSKTISAGMSPWGVLVLKP